MSKPIIIAIILIVLAIISQALGGIISTFYNDELKMNMFGYQTTMTSTHLWSDASFVIYIAFVIIIFYDTKM